jgi:hypothetical protein
VRDLNPSQRKVYNDPTNYRRKFTEVLESPEVNKNAATCTLTTVSTMNEQMIREKVPMAEPHYHTAVASIQKGDPLPLFLAAENSAVLESAKTHPPNCSEQPVYASGVAFHKVIHTVMPNSTPPNSDK